MKDYLINKDLYLENIKDYENIDLRYVLICDSVGIYTRFIDNKRKYIVYMTDERGSYESDKDFDDFDEAVRYAKRLYESLLSYLGELFNCNNKDLKNQMNYIKKYFTNENIITIYKRLKDEANINDLPFLGNKVEYGLGDICLEESENIFKFYIIDRASKFEYEEFNDIRDAIERLIKAYQDYELVQNPDKMREIFYQTLGLEKELNMKLKN